MKKFCGVLGVLLATYVLSSVAKAENSICDVWFVGEITRVTVRSELIDPILKCQKGLKVRLLLDTSGGDAYAMMMAISAARDIFERKINTHIINCTMSSGVSLAWIGDHVSIAHDGCVYIHPVSGTMDGEVVARSDIPPNLRRDFDELSNYAEKRYVELLVSKSNRTEDQIRMMMKKHTMLTAQKALEYGFVDEIIPAKQ